MKSQATKRVLDVGQCNPDHASIRRELKAHFDVTIDRAHFIEDAVESLKANRYDLVLVNRIFHEDGTEGLKLIRKIKADAALAAVPVMLVSNYSDAQASAVKAGALPGFGKDDLGGAAIIEKLSPILGDGFADRAP